MQKCKNICVQLSLFERFVIATVERPNGSTYEQKLRVDPGDTPYESVQRFQFEVLGNPYGWCTTGSGRRKRYIKRNAYLVVSWREEE